MLAALGAGVGAAALPGKASATLARPVGLRELVHTSAHALIALPVSMACERLEGRYGSHLVTHTTLRVSRALDGRPPGSAELTVRTLGGRLGRRGEIVHGEAVPRIGQEALFFLYPIGAALHGVTAMAQGHYPVERRTPELAVLRASEQLPRFADRYVHQVSQAAVQVLEGRPVAEVEGLLYRELHGDAR